MEGQPSFLGDNMLNLDDTNLTESDKQKYRALLKICGGMQGDEIPSCEHCEFYPLCKD